MEVGQNGLLGVTVISHVEEDFKLEVEIVTVPNLHMVASSA
jgi:hypothetical protein